MTVIERSGKTDNGTKVVADPGICGRKMFLATQSRNNQLAHANVAHTYIRRSILDVVKLVSL